MRPLSSSRTGRGRADRRRDIRTRRRDHVVFGPVQQKYRRRRLRRPRDDRPGRRRTSRRRAAAGPEVDDVAVVDVAQQRGRRLGHRLRQVAQRARTRRRRAPCRRRVERATPRDTDARRRAAARPAPAAPRDRRCRAESPRRRSRAAAGRTVVCCAGAARLRRSQPGFERMLLPDAAPAGAQVPQHARQVVVAAKREHERDAVGERRTSGGDDRESAAEADAHQADAVIRRESDSVASHTAARSIASVIAGVISNATAPECRASRRRGRCRQCRARRTSRGSSMPAGCSPEPAAPRGDGRRPARRPARASSRSAVESRCRARARRRVSQIGEPPHRALHVRGADRRTTGRERTGARPTPPPTRRPRRGGAPRRRPRTSAHVTLRVARQVGQVGRVRARVESARTTHLAYHAPPAAPAMRSLIIAIDGPSGAGKGTVARAVARELGYRHVDSGAMYRAVGWKAFADGVPLDDEAAVDGARRADR